MTKPNLMRRFAVDESDAITDTDWALIRHLYICGISYFTTEGYEQRHFPSMKELAARFNLSQASIEVRSCNEGKSTGKSWSDHRSEFKASRDKQYLLPTTPWEENQQRLDARGLHLVEIQLTQLEQLIENQDIAIEMVSSLAQELRSGEGSLETYNRLSGQVITSSNRIAQTLRQVQSTMSDITETHVARAEEYRNSIRGIALASGLDNDDLSGIDPSAVVERLNQLSKRIESRNLSSTSSDVSARRAEKAVSRTLRDATPDKL